MKVSLFLAMCVVTAPMGVCRAEVADGWPLEIADGWPLEVAAGYPAWATEAWVNYAAHIVGSEARNVPAADLAVACTIVRDVERGYHPWRLHPGRWHGYGSPDALDYAAVQEALSGGCEDIPVFRYCGNLSDAWYWRRMGKVDGQPLSLWLSEDGRSAVVGVP